MDDKQRNMGSSREIDENNAWDKLSMWETIVDRRIQDWLGDGDMSGHSGAGQPLNLERFEGVPDDERMAQKIMKDHDVVPPWLSKGYALRDKYEKLMRRLQQYVRDYQRRKQAALVSGSYVKEREADDRWQAAIKGLRRDIASYNRELLDYNLMTPPQIGQMVPLDADEVIRKARQSAGV
jgi:hypothetical protein